MSESKRSGAGRPAPPQGELPVAGLGVAAGLNADELEVLRGVLARQLLDPTEVLFREGDPGDRLYVLARGRISIAIRGTDGSRGVMTYAPGAMLGEASLLEGAPHPATAAAAADSVVYSLSRASLDALAASHPALASKLLLNIGRHLSGRLRHAPDVLRKLSDASG
jgi:CRP-like cAMP-binding protein